MEDGREPEYSQNLPLHLRSNGVEASLHLMQMLYYPAPSMAGHQLLYLPNGTQDVALVVQIFCRGLN